MNDYKNRMETLEKLFNILKWSVKPEISDVEDIVSFFNENNPEDYDLRDASNCADRVQELMNELESFWEDEYNYCED